jgi:hypothetical protein
MKNRECPYCHQTVSLKWCLKYLLRGTDYSTVCNHCGRSIKLAKEPIPGFKYSFMAGFLSIYIPMQVCLYAFNTTFVEALIYSLPFVIVCLSVSAYMTLRSLFFDGDI